MLFALALLASAHLSPSDVEVPFRQPQLAVSGNEVAMSFGAGNAIYFRKSLDGAATFSNAVKVAESVYMPLGMHRGPRVGYAGKVLVISAIAGVAAKRGADGNLFIWRSADGGSTWSKPIQVNDVPDSAREGLQGMATLANGTVFLTWLDLRSKGTKLYGVLSTDGGASWSKNMLVYESPEGTICQCCHPTVALSDNGEIRVMWRNAIAGSRDMYTAVSSDSGKTWQSQKLGKGTWRLDACPMDGGGLSVDAKKVLHTVWRRDGQIFATSGRDLERQIGSGKNPAIASGKAGEYFVWNDGPAVKLVRPGKPESETITTEGAFPVLAGSGPVYAAWEEKGGIGFARIE